MLEVQDLRFAYPGSEEVIRGVTCSLAAGARLAIVGENGSGKTTLARLMCGLLEPTFGTVTVDGLDTHDTASIYEVRRKVGIVFQDPEDQIVETTVEREIGFGPRNLGLTLGEVDERVDGALATFGITHLRKRPCHLLSAGEKQIVAVASVFVMRPDYIILDESTSLLDSGSRRDLVLAIERLLKETGAGLAFVSMRLEDVWMCDEVIFLRGGLVDFKGGKDGFLRHLKERELPLAGTGLLVSELDDAVPGFMPALATRDSLSGDSLASVLVDLARAAQRSRRGGRAGGMGDPDGTGGIGRRDPAKGGGACQ